MFRERSAGTNMADSVSCGDLQTSKPPSKRRRVLNASAIVPVPVYSSRVSSSLELKPAACLLPDRESSDDGIDENLWVEFSSRRPPPPLMELSDSEDESEPRQDPSQPPGNPLERPRCPSPPADSPVQRQSSKAKRKISEINKKLRAVSSVLSPESQNRGSGRCRTRSSRRPDPDDDDDDDDVIVLEGADSLHEFPLKIRCRTEVHKVLVLPSTRLSAVIGQLSVILEVPPPRLLLLREELELATDATIGQLGLGIADIIECVVTSSQEQLSVKLKLQSRDRNSSQEFSILREAPLSSIFSQYLSGCPAGAARKARFHFDGARVDGSQTPAQLDMEDGDIIEVWA